MEELLAMGFEHGVAQRALRKANGDVGAAIDICLSGEGSGSAGGANLPAPVVSSNRSIMPVSDVLDFWHRHRAKSLGN